jgi:2'-5' RNA ligase
MKDFWSAYREPSAQPIWHWHILWDDQPAVQELAKIYDLALRDPALSVVPSSRLHLTLWKAHPSNQISPEERQLITHRVQRRCSEQAPIELTVGPTEIVGYSINLAVAPNPDFAKLLAILTEETAAIVGPERLPQMPSKVFWPHIALAYGRAEADDKPIQARLDQLTRPPLQATIRRIRLVNQYQQAEGHNWTVTFPISLGGA